MQIWQPCQKNVRARAHIIFHPLCREVDIFMFLPKNCFLRSSSGYVESNPSEKIDKNQLFSEAQCFFLKKPKYGRKQHLSLETPMDYWILILTKLAKVFAKKRVVFGSKSENKYEVNYLPQKCSSFLKKFFSRQKLHFLQPCQKNCKSWSFSSQSPKKTIQL